jgi:hypothetical protein
MRLEVCVCTLLPSWPHFTSLKPQLECWFCQFCRQLLTENQENTGKWLLPWLKSLGVVITRVSWSNGDYPSCSINYLLVYDHCKTKFAGVDSKNWKRMPFNIINILISTLIDSNFQHASNFLNPLQLQISPSQFIISVWNSRSVQILFPNHTSLRNTNTDEKTEG